MSLTQIKQLLLLNREKENIKVLSENILKLNQHDINYKKSFFKMHFSQSCIKKVCQS